MFFQRPPIGIDQRTLGPQGGIVGVSGRMQEIYQVITRMASCRSTVLIQGETGTGKELIARAIHAAGPRADRPFVPIDCGALAESLLESELFGHVKGAFTGASVDKRGFFEAAHGGTCLLDEVGDVSPGVQAKLLRVLQEHEIRRVGGTESIKVDVRIIAATNKELGALVADGKFREDLFYRLSVVTIVPPPLRDRREDIPLLANHFLKSYVAANDRLVSDISLEAMARLVAYDWPGNVRELEHAIEHAVALTLNSVLVLEDLPPKLRAGTGQAGSPAAPSLSLKEVVARHVSRVLREARWNKKLAAQLLGIPRRTLYRLTKRHGILWVAASERAPTGGPAPEADGLLPPVGATCPQDTPPLRHLPTLTIRELARTSSGSMLRERITRRDVTTEPPRGKQPRSWPGTSSPASPWTLLGKI
jgi:two-component system, NtrC family, response regulator AtoC